MSRYAKEPDGGSGLPDVEPGNYAGRCYRIVDLGTTHEEYQGEVKTRTRLMISCELPDELMTDGRPFSVTWWVTNSLHEKANLRIGLETWRKKPFTTEELKGFDLATILGVPGMVTVQQNVRGKSSISGIGPLPKGMVCGPAVNPKQAFWLDEYSDEAFNALPDGIKEMVRKSDEYRAIQKARTGSARSADQPEPPRSDDFDESIPF
jgi:hypothetical protein